MRGNAWSRACVLLFSMVLLLAFTGVPKAQGNGSEWTMVTPEPTKFMGRDLNPTCSGFPGTDPTFSFFYRTGSSRNLVIYFQGGGVCWNPVSCITDPTYYPDVTEADDPNNVTTGIFDFGNPQNPFADWNFVFIPYCTGDLHWGSREWTYNYAPGESWVIHHRGLDNFLVVLKWIRLHMRHPRKILVTGSSAGAYGAIGNFPWVRRVFRGSRIYVLGDAGTEVGPREFDAVAHVHWDIERPRWASGTMEPMYLPDFWVTQAKRHRRVRFGEYTTAWDATLIWFRNEILSSFWISTREANVCDDFHAHMLETLAEKQKAANYRSYMAAGEVHTILLRPEFYTVESGGVTFLEWVQAMINNSPDWENVQCEGDCGKPDVCPY